MSRNPFRMDRLATLHMFAPLRRILNKESGPIVPVLMYHSISDPDGRFSHPYFETNTSSRVFKEHMKYLFENGYSCIGLNELPFALETESSTGKFVVLTFDDGYRDFCDNAFFILQKYGFKATVFLTTGFMGTNKTVLTGKKIMDWEDAKQLQKKGIVFGSHTVNHLKLENLSLEKIEFEIGESKNEIERNLGKYVDCFSYPYAFPETKVGYLDNYFGILNNFGYKVGVTTVIGRVHRSDNMFVLKRIPINDYDDLALFRAKLDGNYDWVHVPQYLKKKCYEWIGKKK